MGINCDDNVNLDNTRKANRNKHGQDNKSADEDGGCEHSKINKAERSCCSNSNCGRSTKTSKAFKADARIPAGSWVQHQHEEGFMFWRNNSTGQCTRDLWFGPWGTTPPSQCFHPVPATHHLVPAPFAPIAPGKTGPSPPRKTGKWKGKGKEKETNKLPSTWFCQPWEEIYHPVTGKKHWRHRNTGEKRYKDPIW